MPAEEQFDPAIERQVAAALAVLEKREQFPLARPSARRRHPLRMPLAKDGHTHFLTPSEPDRAERGGELPGQLEFSFEQHRVRGIEQNRDVQLFFLMKLF